MARWQAPPPPPAVDSIHGPGGAVFSLTLGVWASCLGNSEAGRSSVHAVASGVQSLDPEMPRQEQQALQGVSGGASVGHKKKQKKEQTRTRGQSAFGTAGALGEPHARRQMRGSGGASAPFVRPTAAPRPGTMHSAARRRWGVPVRAVAITPVAATAPAAPYLATAERHHRRSPVDARPPKRGGAAAGQRGEAARKESKDPLRPLPVSPPLPQPWRGRGRAPPTIRPPSL